jgi:pyrroloquinoline quinone biosynthesis protein B
MKIWPALLLLSCSSLSDQQAVPATPYVLVLGTAQDAGLPQLGCTAPCCEAARADPAQVRLVAALLIVDPRTNQRWLIDATPDLGAQVERARGHPPGRAAAQPTVGRPALFEGVFLTHAHMGHYTGLAELGREAYAASDLPVYCTAAMASFLTHNGPWSQLVERGEVSLAVFQPGEPVVLSRDPDTGVPDLTVTAFRVPHRDEFSDTVGYRVDGPSASLLYIPDIDKWERAEHTLSGWLDSVDVALLDGTFYADGEIPGRSMADIPHPFITETLALLQALPVAPRARVVFTHLNHSNPAARAGSEAQLVVQAAGAHVAREGEVFEL